MFSCDHCRNDSEKPTVPQGPASFYCPVSMELMSDPVMVATGHSYDRTCIQKWLEQGNRTCPVTGLRLRHLELTPNIALRNAIQVSNSSSKCADAADMAMHGAAVSINPIFGTHLFPNVSWLQEWASQNGVQLNRPDAAQQTTFRLDENHSRNILQVRQCVMVYCLFLCSSSVHASARTSPTARQQHSAQGPSRHTQ